MNWLMDKIGNKIFGKGLDAVMEWLKNFLNGAAGNRYATLLGVVLYCLATGLVGLVPMLAGVGGIVGSFLLAHQAEILSILAYVVTASKALVAAGLARRALNA